MTSRSDLDHLLATRRALFERVVAWVAAANGYDAKTAAAKRAEIEREAEDLIVQWDMAAAASRSQIVKSELFDILAEIWRLDMVIVEIEEGLR